MIDCDHEYEFYQRVCKKCGWTMEEIVDGVRRVYAPKPPTLAERRALARKTQKDVATRRRAEELANAFLDGMSYALKSPK